MHEFDAIDSVLSGAEPTTVQSPTEPQASPPVAETPPAQEPEENTPTQQADPAPETVPDSATPEEIFSGNRQNQAFAQMRVQNKQLSETIARLGQIMQLPPSLPPDQLVPIVQQRLLEIEAKANNIPLDLAQRLEQAEQLRHENEAAMLRNNAELSFQKVKDAYKLDQNQLIEFAKQLNDAGKNPYQTPVDLIQEYRMLNFDRLMEDARKQATQEAAALKKKADQQSTVPSKTSGTSSDPHTTVSSMADLSRLLEGGR